MLQVPGLHREQCWVGGHTLGGLGAGGGAAESEKGPVWPAGGKQAWKVMSGNRERQAPSPLRGGPLGVKVPQRGRELGWPPGKQRLEEPKCFREGLV